MAFISETGPDISTIRWIRGTIPVANVVTLTSATGIQLLPAKAGIWYFPIYFSLIKTAGAAYTITGTANIGYGPITGPGIAAFSWINSAGLMDQTARTEKFQTTPAIGLAGSGTINVVGQGWGIILQGTGSLSVGSDIGFSYAYMEVPGTTQI